MKTSSLLDIKIPIIYINPPYCSSPDHVGAVSEAGGLGVTDRTVSGGSDMRVPRGTPHGIRVRLRDLPTVSGQPDVIAALIPFEDAGEIESVEEKSLAQLPVPVIVEVGSAKQARGARRAGAAAVIARGNEGPGWVSETGGMVLLQEVLNAVDLPVFLRGGVSRRSAAGAICAGAAGIVLDVHMMLAADSVLDSHLKEFFSGLSVPATVTLGDALGKPCRVYSRVGTKMVRELRSYEDTLTVDDLPELKEKIDNAISATGSSPDRDPMLLPISEDIAEAGHAAEAYGTIREILKAYCEAMNVAEEVWPFGEDNKVCSRHGTRYPIVQGPMAHVSDSPDFLAAVVKSGGLPFLAMGNMPRPIAEEGVRLSREKTGGTFGVGLIGLEVNRACYEAHLEIMADNPPPFAILAAGGPELAKRIEEMGTVCYLHCPAPAVVSEALKSDLRHFVFEGCESGGHIGSLGSLDLWSANLRELEKAANDGLDLTEVTVLFAGGIASARASAFIVGLTADLVKRGLNVGLQMGTAYLATEEAVSTCAITKTYQELTVDSAGTVVIGRTVNTRARAAGSPMAATLIEREQQRIRDGISLSERKELYEHDNLGALRLASKGCAIDPNTATWDCPVFCDLEPEDQLGRGLYLMGQVVSLLEKPLTMEQLHSEIIHRGREVFETRPVIESTVTIEEDVRPAAEVIAPGSVEISEPPQEVIFDKEPIAVVGIGLHLPGSDSVSEYWDQILTGRSGICEIPEGRWDNPDYYYHPDPKVPDKTYSRIGGFVRSFSFDPLKYRIPPSVAAKMDRTQQLAVSCVGQALEDAGLTPAALKGQKVGIVIGNSMGGETTDRYACRVDLPRTLTCMQTAFAAAGIGDDVYQTVASAFESNFLEGLPGITEDSLPGELANVISGRVANVFNLEGPNFTVDAACASSMAAVMNAVAALRSGTIDYAISGGVDAAMHPSSFIKFCKIGALSPDGSRPFDEGANGFVMGEGVGMMILKRLSDAVRDGDRIYGTIMEIGSSSDGKGKGITAPNAAGQERAVRAVFNGSGITENSVGLIEAHGTSTAVGDKTELMVLDKLFRDHGIRAGTIGIGSVKSQIGHLKAAAGAAGMIKALLALHHKTLPPTINVKNPSSCIDWKTSPLFLVTDPKPWPVNGALPRRAGVSAFGFGGTNFHVIFQEHVPGLRIVSSKEGSPEVVEFRAPDWPKPPELTTDGEAWTIGAANVQELAAKVSRLLSDIDPTTYQSLLSSERTAAASEDVRLGFAAKDAEDAKAKLALVQTAVEDPKKMAFFPAKGIHFVQHEDSKASNGIAFLFPGQGSQYPFMVRDLAERFRVVAETIQEADDTLRSLDLPAVTESIFPRIDPESGNLAGATDALKDTQLLQPAILTANTAMLRLLAQFGVEPAAVAGHSLGEYAACVAAGVFSFKHALEAVAVRGREMARVSIEDSGLMMSVPADARLVDEVLSKVDGYVVAANKNSPKQTVISGLTQAVKDAAKLFKERGIDCIVLPVSAAFHSGVVAPAREPFMKTLGKLTVNPPSVPILSNVTGDFYPTGPGAPAQILDLLGKQFAAPVEWVKIMRRLHNEGIRIFLECGPKRVMTNLAIDTLGNDITALPTNHPKKGGIAQLCEALAALAAEGVPVDFDGPGKSYARAKSAGKPALRLVRPGERADAEAPEPEVIPGPGLLDDLLDDELRQMAEKEEFRRFVELQGDPIRSLMKSGFQTYLTNIVPMERTIRQVESEGMDFQPVVVSGISAGLPSDVRFPFDRENLDELILGKNFIKKVPRDGRVSMLEKNVERLYKGPDGEAELRVVDDVSGVIQLAGFFTEEDVSSAYGIDHKLVEAMDITTRLAIAAAIEALRDAGIPLTRASRITSTGNTLPDAWALPASLREETGVVFASAFPGLASLVDEVTRETAARYGSGARKRLINFYSGLLERIRDDRDRDSITKWFTREFTKLNPDEPDDVYTFNRSFLLRVMTLAQGQVAQFLKARGPNTHVDAACASTTQAVLVARDWIRTGQAKRVIVVGADDVAGRTLLPWVGSGFLAMGAATTEGNVGEAALPFDDRRNGLILGSAAAGMVLEREDLVKSRGMEPIVSIEAGATANSAYHGTRLDVDHISSVMNGMISKWEERSGSSRDRLSQDVFFMSHETYSPKRGGSSAAEIAALRKTFGDKVKSIPIANTKGFTGHTMGVGVEDVTAMRCLQKGMIPPIPNLKTPDPEFADLQLSKGGKFEASYCLRLAAGFGSQIVMALYKARSREENRIIDMPGHREWLRKATGYQDPVMFVEDRTLRARERTVDEVSAEESQTGTAEVKSKPAAQREAATTGTATPEVRDRILKLLSEKTGYPPDMLDTGLDLEADLGIDTVKQAEFITEVREAFDIPRIEGLKIADFPTIEHIIGFVTEHTVGETATDETGHATDAAGGSTEEIESAILGLLSEKTGYPSDMLEVDLDLEADLGIDTVKQAEFITDVREAFGIPRIEGLKIADFPTIRHIIGFVAERRAEVAQETLESPEERVEESVSAPEAEIKLYETRLVRLPDPVEVPMPAVDSIVITGGSTELQNELKRAFEAAGLPNAAVLDTTWNQEQLRERRVGIVNLGSCEHGQEEVNRTLTLLLEAAQTFEQGPVFLASVVQEDGALGFESPSDHGHIAGAIAGATKSFSREYPDCRTRLLDVHPDVNEASLAGMIIRSLSNAFPVETGIGDDLSLRAVRFVPVTDRSHSGTVQPGDVILVTGGARGITAACLDTLANVGDLTFVLLGRTEISGKAEQMSTFGPEEWEQEKQKIIDRLKRSGTKPTPVAVEKELSQLKSQAEAYATIRALKAKDCEVIYRAVDICNRDQLAEVTAEAARLCGRIDVIVHGAGIDVSRALKSKTVEQMETVISVKVDGMRNLMDALERHGTLPRRILSFGSVSGRFGNMAQTDYAAGNDGLAHLMRWYADKLDVQASIIDWAPWAEIGMAVRGSVQQSLEAAGIDFIPPGQGADIFMRELARPSGPSEVLAAGRIGPFTDDAFTVPGVEVPEDMTTAGQAVKIESMLSGEHVRALVTLDPSHPLLDHHRIDRAAVLPGVGGIEIMRTVASLLDPQVVNGALENVRFHSPLKIFKDELFTAEVEVIKLVDDADSSPLYWCRISSWFIDRDGRRVGEARLHHECRIRPERPQDPPDTTSELWPRTVIIPEREIYSIFFHGPAFQFLDRVIINADGNRVRFRFKDTAERPSMLCDLVPAVLEAVFQAGAALAVESRGIMALPTGIGTVLVHDTRALPLDGELTLAREETHEQAEERAILTFNAFIRDDTGRIVLSVKGFEAVELDKSTGFPGRVLEELVRQEEIRPSLEAGDESFFKSILTLKEAEEFAGKVVPKRAEDWISGRLALKRCAERLKRSQGRDVASLSGIEVVSDDMGKPSIQVVTNPGVPFGDASLSHSNGLVVAEVTAPGLSEGLGVDIEAIEERSESWMHDYFTEEEIALAGDGVSRNRRLTEIWSLKEAALKAMGTGLRFDLKDIVVSSIDVWGRASIELRNEAAHHFEGTFSGEIEARVDTQGDTVIARVMIRSYS
jgi:phosphopantetheine--protein transferase-like protein